MSETATIEAMQAATETALSDLNTSQPGVVVSYDARRNRAVVRPSLPKRLADGTELPAPDIHEVPIMWTSGGGGTFTFPIRPGDGVMLQSQQRSLEGWLGGSDAAPDDPRRFDMSDVVAVPGLRSASPPTDPDAVVLTMGDAAVRIEPGNVVRIKAARFTIEAPDVEIIGDVRVTQDVKAATVSLRQHVQTGVRSGGEISGPPRP